MTVTVILDTPNRLHTRDASRGGYQPIPVDARRDALQGLLEIPALVTPRALPKGKRVLEVGCGRGNAFPYLLQRHAGLCSLSTKHQSHGLGGTGAPVGQS